MQLCLNGRTLQIAGDGRRRPPVVVLAVDIDDGRRRQFFRRDIFQAAQIDAADLPGARHVADTERAHAAMATASVGFQHCVFVVVVASGNQRSGLAAGLPERSRGKTIGSSVVPRHAAPLPLATAISKCSTSSRTPSFDYSAMAGSSPAPAWTNMTQATLAVVTFSNAQAATRVSLGDTCVGCHDCVGRMGGQ